jgi:RNA polymerase sigma factor (sigma-70 family)
MEDRELVEASLTDPAVFAEIFRRHFEAIFRFLVRQVGWDQASDLASEVFVRAFRKRAQFDRSRPSCRPWLYGIAMNLVRDEGRRRARRFRLLARLAAAEGEHEPMAEAEDRLEAEAWRAKLRATVGSLGAGERDVLLLRALGGLTYQEIAEALEIPLGTVRSRLSRAKARIRERFPDLERSMDDGLTETVGDDERD